jgi:dTDP-4-amino-4,6-dideoxygalactose transaminase
MQIVTFPDSFIDAYLAEAREIMTTGKVAEGKYFRELCGSYVPGKLSLPVSSGGSAIFALLAYQKHVCGRELAIIQSNTMRAVYTVPTLLGMKTRVVDSSYHDFMSMNHEALERALEDASVRASAVVVYSVIGGYLAPSFERIAETCRRADVPLIVDGAHAHYLNAVVAQPDVDIAYSFYATKILPAGEGGLVATADIAKHDWVRRFLMYDRFENQLEVGLNLRASELSAALIHRLMTSEALVQHFKTDRVAIAADYEVACKLHGIRYLAPSAAADYNGYKLIVLDPIEQVRRFGSILTEHQPTSAVFDTDVLGRPTSLPHWCPPTYASLNTRLRTELRKAVQRMGP